MRCTVPQMLLSFLIDTKCHALKQVYMKAKYSFIKHVLR